MAQWKRRRSQGGRKRQSGERYESGKLKPIRPALAIQRRAEMAGCSIEEAAVQTQPGFALGQLLMRQVVDQDEYDAGLKFMADWNAWSGMAGLPAHEQRMPTGRCRPDPDADDWLKARERHMDAVKIIRALPQSGLVWAAVENVVMDNWPRSLDEMTLFLGRPRSVAALKSGLSALAKHYRIGSVARVA